MSEGIGAVRAPRIVVFIHSLAGGGAERVAVDLAGHWAAAGWQVLLVTQADPATDAYPIPAAVCRESLGTAGQSGGGARAVWANGHRVRALRKTLRRFEPDIVLGMMTTSSILAVVAAAGLPMAVIATEHTHPPAQALSAGWRWLRRRVYPRASRVVALTHGTARWLQRHVPGSRVDVIPNAVRWPLPNGIPMLSAPSDSTRRRLLAVGRLHPDKGFDSLVAAFAQIAASHPQWDLVILGEGAQRQFLERQVDEAGLRARVSLPGRAGNVGDWYACAEVYVLSSRVEGLSNTLLEAMASGLAAVAFDCETGPREIIEDGVDGLLVRPAGDVDALARALVRVMDDEPLRRHLASRAPGVKERFSTERVLARWDAVFNATGRMPAGAAPL